MSFGLTAVNNNNELAITDSSTNYHYMGSYNASSTFGGGGVVNNYLTFAYYTVSAPNRPIVFMEPSGGNRFALQAVTDIGGGSWRVLIIYTGSPPRIHVFSTLTYTTTGQQYGMAVYRANGTLAFDTTRNPLALNKVTTYTTPGPLFSFSGKPPPTTLNTGGANIGALPTRAAFFHYQTGVNANVIGTSYQLYFYYCALDYRSGDTFNTAWQRSTSATQAMSTANRYQFWDTAASPLFVIDAAKYD